MKEVQRQSVRIIKRPVTMETDEPAPEVRVCDEEEEREGDMLMLMVGDRGKRGQSPALIIGLNQQGLVGWGRPGIFWTPPTHPPTHSAVLHLPYYLIHGLSQHRC